jgi:hypothetical protein
VRSVYLRRGLASVEPFYGLSDIDLLVLVDPRIYGRVAARVTYEYELLRRVVPMLAEDELAVYSAAQLQSLYRYSPFYRQRFNRGRHGWMRLWGEDVFQYLPEDDGSADALSAHELGPAWHYLSQELLPDDDRPDYLRRYVAYKWTGETARAALYARGEVQGMTREAAIHRASLAFPEIAPALDSVRADCQRLLSRRPFVADKVLESYILLAQKALENGRETSARDWVRLRILAPAPTTEGTCFREAALGAIEETCAGLEGVQQAVFVPRLGFEPIAEIGMDPSVLAGTTIDAFDLVLMGQSLPAVESLRELNRSLGRFGPTVVPFFCDGELAVALRAVRGWPIKDPVTAPEFFAGLASARPLHGMLSLAGCVDVRRGFEQEDVLDRRAESLLAPFGTGEAYRLPVLGFLVLFWEAGRACWLAAQSRESTIEVPVTSYQVLDALSRLTPAEARVLHRIHQEYLTELRGEPSEAVRYLHWASRYARRLEEMLTSRSALTGDIPTPARTELTISVVIITRNRAALLEKALASLVEQDRPPDQVVVVDNASSDNTPAVARSFADRLNLVLVHEETLGIPHARNAGLRHCTGDIVASLDDDCQADRRWLAELEIPFLKDPRIGAVGGSLVPVEGQRGLVARFYRTRMKPESGSRHRASR